MGELVVLCALDASFSPFLLQSQGGQAWIGWMVMGMHKKGSSQSPTVSGFSEALHDMSLELCEANGKLPLIPQQLPNAHSSAEQAAGGRALPPLC